VCYIFYFQRGHCRGLFPCCFVVVFRSYFLAADRSPSAPCPVLCDVLPPPEAWSSLSETCRPKLFCLLFPFAYFFFLYLRKRFDAYFLFMGFFAPSWIRCSRSCVSAVLSSLPSPSKFPLRSVVFRRSFLRPRISSDPFRLFQSL